MKFLQEAIAEEQRYVKDRLEGVSTELLSRLEQFGYTNLSGYFADKKKYLFENWISDVRYIDEDYLDTQMEQDIINCNEGIYIIQPKSDHYAFHGDDKINYDECENANVRVIEMNYRGGTIIGSKNDLGILLVLNRFRMVDSGTILDSVTKIIREYIPEATRDGNDILVGGKKVMGSMTRYLGDSFVWAAQFTFGEYDNLIKTLCCKECKKTPWRIDDSKLTRDILERRLLRWLRKQEP